MDEDYQPKFPHLLQQWRGHDLAFQEDLGGIRPWFYEGLDPRNELSVWRFIEENYLSKYRGFIGVRFEWSAGGLWRLPFPGSVGYGEHLSPRDFDMPESLVAKIREWHDDLDRRDPTVDPEDEDFDYQTSWVKGLAAAREVKLFLGEDHYVEFEPFQEVALVDGVPVELEVPGFILEVTR